MSSSLLLTETQARVLACLVEKGVTTPAYYPMTVNGVMTAANQKSNRAPVMQLRETDVGGALTDLETMKLVARDESSSRATKWRHRFEHETLLPKPVLAVLVALMLRGPQTIAELKSHGAPLGGPDDADGVRAALDRMADRADPLVRELPRAPGQSATRWAHLLCGEPVIPEPSAAPSAGSARGHQQELIEALQARVATLEEEVAALKAALGI
ncbi:YceH family protein [Algiphilus sp.]|uniref:YceH family protein n=1 Tax=Algiphilus sp. TaxID=1872431 RepID=UPI003B52A6B6